MTLVSALIPAYNRCEHLLGAIKTVLDQTYDDIEAVVVDDCSTDRTPAVLDQFERNDRVRTVRNSRNRGIAASYNRAAEVANRTYLCILDLSSTAMYRGTY